jgi:hypothetical protein
MISIDNIEYKEEDLTEEQKNWVYALNEILTSKRKIMIELEKINVLTNYYNEKLKQDLVKED